MAFTAKRKQSRSRRSVWRSFLVLGAIALAMGACGEDEPNPQQRPGGQSPGGGGAGTPPAAKRGGSLTGIGKVPDQYRHQFVDDDFRPDPTGLENRNPFRSFVQSTEDTGPVLETTELCTAENTIASNYSLRDLNLIGIVLRRTKQFALFRDSASLGHIVNRGDCLGKEKAVVDFIGTGFVRLEVTPDAPQGTQAPPPQKRQIALYPQELSLEDDAASASDKQSQ